MTSSINTDNIDPEFPVAGQDNNSQGFRDNFLYIKEGLESAATDITDLQVNSARLDQENNFQNNIISNATTIQVYEYVYTASEGEPAGQVEIDITNGSFQFVYINSESCTVKFKNWPDINKYAKVRLHLIGDSLSTKTVTLETENPGLLKFPKGFSNGLSLVYSVDKNVSGTYSGNQPQIVVDNIDDLSIGFNVVQIANVIPSATTIADIDTQNNIVTLDKNLLGTINDGQQVTFTNPDTMVKVIDAWTYNGGTTVFVSFVGEYEL